MLSNFAQAPQLSVPGGLLGMPGKRGGFQSLAHTDDSLVDSLFFDDLV